MPHPGHVEECTKSGTRKWVNCHVTIRIPIRIHGYPFNLNGLRGILDLLKNDYRGEGLLCVCDRSDLRRYKVCLRQFA